MADKKFQDVKESAIIPPTRRFRYGNEEYQFWIGALQFLEDNDIAPQGTVTNFAHVLQGVPSGLLDGPQWWQALQVTGYGNALATLGQWLSNVPQGTQVPDSLVDNYNRVINFRNSQRGPRGGLDAGHQAALDNWGCRVGAFLAQLIDGSLNNDATIRRRQAPVTGYVHGHGDHTLFYVAVGLVGYVTIGLIVMAVAPPLAPVWWTFGPK